MAVSRQKAVDALLFHPTSRLAPNMNLRRQANRYRKQRRPMDLLVARMAHLPQLHRFRHPLLLRPRYQMGTLKCQRRDVTQGLDPLHFVFVPVEHPSHLSSNSLLCTLPLFFLF